MVRIGVRHRRKYSTECESRRFVALFVLGLLPFVISTTLACSRENEKRSAPVSVPAPKTGPLVELLPQLPFGAAAQIACRNACDATPDSSQDCLSACGHVSAERYASSLLFGVQEPTVIAQGIVTACRVGAQKMPPEATASNSKPQSLEEPVLYTPPTAEELAKEVSSSAMRKLYSPFVEFLQTPPESEEDLVYWPKVITRKFFEVRRQDQALESQRGAEEADSKVGQQLHLAFCVREALYAVQMAILEAAESRDVYAEKLYRVLEVQLELARDGIEAPIVALSLPNTDAAVGGGSLSEDTL